ncbi:MAG: hypothetical protein AAGC78_11830 [Cellvibrio sp.]|uniref:hypothetical protein n=1 Tax=Cellvibrio sp. TaxID=1965322 RepID=UPI0031B1C54A
MSLLKLAVSVLLVFSLSACNDVINKPLSGMGAPNSPDSMDGNWISEADGSRLDITKTSKVDWYDFKYQEKDKLTIGKFSVSYFKQRRVLNIDLASVRVNDQPVVLESSQAFLIVGALVDDDELTIIPADMDKFEQNFSKYFYASPIKTEALCKKDNQLCTSNFSGGNVLLSKRMKKFNDDFLKKYRVVFPSKGQVVFKPAKAS